MSAGRDRALAQDARGHARRPSNRRRSRRAAADRTVVDDQRESSPRARSTSCGGRRVRLAGDVRRAGRDRPEATRKGARHVVVGQAQAERGAAAAEQRRQRDVRAPLEDDRQPPGQNASASRSAAGVTHGQVADLLERVDQQLDALLGRALLGRDEPLDATRASGSAQTP